MSNLSNTYIVLPRCTIIHGFLELFRQCGISSFILNHITKPVNSFNPFQLSNVEVEGSEYSPIHVIKLLFTISCWLLTAITDIDLWDNGDKYVLA